MDKKYVTPELEIVEFDAEDVITNSDYIKGEGQNGYTD